MITGDEVFDPANDEPALPAPESQELQQDIGVDLVRTIINQTSEAIRPSEIKKIVDEFGSNLNSKMCTRDISACACMYDERLHFLASTPAEVTRMINFKLHLLGKYNELFEESEGSIIISKIANIGDEVVF
jgi:hypothetical protein